MASSLPKLKPAQVSALATEQSFQRGQQYFHNGAIVNPTRQGNTLWADCQGSDLYHPRATLRKQGIETSSCTCPYDRGGICKHQVALLLTYIHEADQFQVIQPLKQLLAKRRREELLQMMEQMVQRHPDLISIVDAPQAPAAGKIPDFAKYRRQVERVFNEDRMGPMATGLESLTVHGQRLSDQQDWLHAGDVYQLLLEAANTYYDFTVFEIDYDGEVCSVVQTIAEGLSDCLKNVENLDSTKRQHWVETLFNAVLKDIELGGIDYAYPAGDAILDHTTDKDWAWLEPQIRQEIKKAGQKRYSSWGKERLVDLLAAGVSNQEQTQTEDDIILELGTPQQRAFYYLEQGNLEEAIAIAHANFISLPGLVTQFADGLLQAKAPDLALKFVQTCAQAGSYSYEDWLVGFYQEYGETEQFLEAQLGLLKLRFTLQGYQKLQGKAEPEGKWKSLRQALIKELKAKKRYDCLMDIALWEQDWKSAKRYLKQMNPWNQATYQKQLADKIKSDEPETAIAFYHDLIQRLIAQRGRDNYRSAAQYLKTICPLYKQLKQLDNFQQYVQQIRTEYRNLPALQEELTRARL